MVVQVQDQILWPPQTKNQVCIALVSSWVCLLRFGLILECFFLSTGKGLM